MKDATKADAVSRNRNESQQKPSSEVKRKYQPKGIEKFSPNELMLLFILVFLCSEALASCSNPTWKARENLADFSSILSRYSCF